MFSLLEAFLRFSQSAFCGPTLVSTLRVANCESAVLNNIRVLPCQAHYHVYYFIPYFLFSHMRPSVPIIVAYKSAHYACTALANVDSLLVDNLQLA